MWDRIERAIRFYEVSGSPMRWFRSWGGLFRGRPGVYLLLRCGILFTMVHIAVNGPVSFGAELALWAVASFLIFDILVAGTSVVMVTRAPRHRLRAIVLTMFSFFQLPIAFAVVYGLRKCDLNAPVDFVRILYFSFVTVGTLGYGDVVPAQGSRLLQGVVIAEVVASLYYLALLIPYFVAQMGQDDRSGGAARIQ
jgi:hypothetical protein